MIEPGAGPWADEGRKAFEALGARFLWLVYHDFSGLARAKIVPGSRVADAFVTGATFNKANWDADVMGALVEGSTYGADAGDFRAVPDPATLVRVPYREGVAQAYCYLFDRRGEWPGDPRRRLLEQAEALRHQGLRVRVGLEAELILVEEFAEPQGTAGTRMFSLSDIDARWEYWADVLDTLNTMGVAVHQLGVEYGAAQYEISLMPADPVVACDWMLTARQVVKALAAERGWIASFMPKPWANRPGNGIHVHLSLSDAAGRDVLTDPDDVAYMTPLARDMLAGLLHHAPAQVALGSPTANSFRRLRPGTWAPAHVTWGVGNRAVLIRIPSGPPSPVRFEHRSGDFSANLYLHVLGLLAATTDGVNADLSLPPITPGAVNDWSDEEARAHGVARLPGTLSAALDALTVDEALKSALGPTIYEHYLAVKRQEARFSDREIEAAPSQSAVTDWEISTYLKAL